MSCDAFRRNVGAGLAPPAQDTQSKTHNERRQRMMSVGVDAHIDPAMRHGKFVKTIGANAHHSVGADASVRPLGNDKFAAIYRKNGRAPCGSMWASTPTNMVRIRIGAFVFAGASCRADRVVRPYGCVPFRIGVCGFAPLCSAGGACPAPTLRRRMFAFLQKSTGKNL